MGLKRTGELPARCGADWPDPRAKPQPHLRNVSGPLATALRWRGEEVLQIPEKSTSDQSEPKIHQTAIALELAAVHGKARLFAIGPHG